LPIITEAGLKLKVIQSRSNKKEDELMNAIRIIGAVSLLIGVIILVIFAAADIFQTGLNPFQFGTWQIGGCIIGAAFIVIGLVLFMKKHHPVTSDGRDSSN
jgi:hypothetical protein